MVRNGFTVIEMLVTIAIIAILAALIATAAVTMGESGKRAQAEMDISTLYKALGEYKFKYSAYPSNADATNNVICYNKATPSSDHLLNILVKLRLYDFDQSRIGAGDRFVDPWGNPYVWIEADPSSAGVRYDEIMVGLKMEFRGSTATPDYIYVFSTGNFDIASTAYSDERAEHWVYLKGGK